MPLSKSAKMRLRAKQSPVRMSQDEKEKRSRKQQQESNVSTWVSVLMGCVVIGAVLVQLYFSIAESPKMMD